MSDQRRYRCLGCRAINRNTGTCKCGISSYQIIEPEGQQSTMTVLRVDLFGNVTDTYQTEAELNGHKETQGRMI